MTKKYISICSLVIGLCILLIILVQCQYFGGNNIPNDNELEFIYEGPKEITSKELYYNENEIAYTTNPNYPEEVNEIGIIPNDTMAYKISSIIVASIYGYELVEKEKPAHIRLINDSIWCVSGSLPKGYDVGGTYSILIEKYSGKILRVTHEK